MSTERMTDARALEVLCEAAGLAGDHPRYVDDGIDDAALAHIAARLRGEAAPESMADAAEAYRQAHAAGEAHGRAMAALEAAPAAPEGQAVATGPYVDRLCRIFQQKPDAGDYSAKVLLDFAAANAKAALSSTAAPAPVAGEAVAALPEKWRGEHYGMTRTSRDCANDLEAALAQDRASQALPSPVPGDQVADIVARWMDKDLSAGVAMLVIKRHLDHCYMQPANDYNRGWVAGANSVTERAAELVEAAERASQAGAAGVPEGWRLVPVKPTEAMLDRGWEYGERIDNRYDREGAYADLLTAAPTPDAEGEVRRD